MGNRIKARAAAQEGDGVTAGEAPQCQQKTFAGAMLGDRFQGIGRATGREAAGGRQQRRQKVAIEMDRGGDGARCQAPCVYHVLSPVIRSSPRCAALRAVVTSASSVSKGRVPVVARATRT